jgi:hypothetical protein
MGPFSLPSDPGTQNTPGLVGQAQDGQTKVRGWLDVCSDYIFYVDLEFVFGVSLFAQNV